MEEMKIEDVKAELQQTQEELERSQFQVYQLLIDLEQSHAQLSQMKQEFEESELLKKQMQAELQQTKSDLEQSQEELHRVQGELDRYKYRETLTFQAISETEREYKQLVWDGWYAYRNGDYNQMVDCLQKSLKCSSLPPSKTVSHWVQSWSDFFQQKGEKFKIHDLNHCQEWNELLQRMTRIKPGAIMKKL
ncbi:putative chromosome segregation ATPase-like protein [Planktothrix agardhii]|uniref:hypothetical protein n=1 Tax=Planktothrix agardhii TaxID=1160 RepID=UPI001B9586C4|nr:hypothetical protein [Planktothrix agardhii]CAD0224470.1 putative chromosome segregation ATPase-like protein [Planktothrix agardhii]